ncbi:hypothetical protein AB0G35_11980 [Streptomyces sp. NPDC021749]|uniref:hypothetical protein n=1 Tax=Streptomyces sp. NPDC021749 TaxID=3154905 RepID=UPI0033CC3A14
MRFAPLGAVGAAAVLAGIVTAAPAPGAAHAAQTPAKKPGKVASVHGAGRIWYVYSPHDDIRFTVDAQAAPFTRPLPGSPLPASPTSTTSPATPKETGEAVGRRSSVR